MQPMASNGPGSFVVMVCETCDHPTLDAMWDYTTTPAQPTAPTDEGHTEGSQ